MNYAVFLSTVSTEPLKIVTSSQEKDILQFCYELIGCDMIEIVRPHGLPDRYVMVVDEEGLLVDDPKFNFMASVLYGESIMGNALIMKEVFTLEGYDIAFLDKTEVDCLAWEITHYAKKWMEGAKHEAN